MNNLVFTFTGAAGSGKDTAAEMLVEYLRKNNVKVLEFAYADFLKTICARNFGYDDSDKENGRVILQTFGTDIVRALDPIIWVETVFNMIDVLRDIYDVFVITDARFENELQPHPWRMGYPIFNIMVKRDVKEDRLKDDARDHVSEELGKTTNLSRFHYVIDNNKTLEDLQKKVEEVYSDVSRARDDFLEKLREEQQAVDEKAKTWNDSVV